jgi:hypothetical protein
MLLRVPLTVEVGKVPASAAATVSAAVATWANGSVPRTARDKHKRFGGIAVPVK